MRFVKPILIIFLCLGFFFYGMVSLEYKYFPYRYIMSVKQYLTHTQDRYQSAEVKNTFFQRLLVKKVYLNQDLSKGGGIENIDRFIFIMTNKGKLLAYDKLSYKEVEISIGEVPMNYDELLSSKYPEQEDFRMEWFRVSGIHAEKTSQSIIQLFATHLSFDETNKCVEHKISRIRLELTGDSLKALGGWEAIFTAEPCIQLEPEYYSANQPFVGHLGGGRMIEFNDSTLMVTVGDYDRNGLNNTEAFSQDPTVPYGKIILVNKETGDWSIYASGVRNALGLFRSKNGIIWETENGPRGGDELNIIKEGANYGWPEVSYGVWYLEEYSISKDGEKGSHSGFEKPVYSWVPSIAPNNLVRIEGNKFDAWKGDLLIGTMKDQSLFRLRLKENNEVVYTERINLDHRVRDITVLNDDSIALITDDGFLIILDDGGSVFNDMDNKFLERRDELNRYDGFSSSSQSLSKANDNKKLAKTIFAQHCSNCHNLKPENTIGPHLNNLFQREVGSLENFNYSTSLMTDKRKWDSNLLRDFLMEPNSKFPDNRMAKVNLTPSEIDSIITFLNSK